jgi:hypothetical protein
MDSFAEIFFSSLQYLQTSPLGRFAALLEGAIAAEASAQTKRIDQIVLDTPDYRWEREVREMEMDELGQVQELGAAFLLVALNQNLETTLGHCLDELFVERPAESRRQKEARLLDEKSRRGSVVERLRNVVPDVESLQGYNEMVEAREIVNAWKHEGVVSETLAKKFPARWERFRPLDCLDEHYARLHGPVREFASSVGDILRSKWRALHEKSKKVAAEK